MNEDFYPALMAGEFYHIYNRGNNRENIFFKEDNYLYFLKKYDYYLSDYLETYAYCLLPNHFHFLVRVKEADEIRIPSLQGMVSVGKDEPISKIVSEQFRRFFISYSQAINKQEGRVGSLFQKNFKRKLITDDSYFTSVVHYVHANPQLHGICEDYMLYPHSSYGRILIEKPSKLNKQSILDWFGGRSEFIKFHEVNKEMVNKRSGFVIEDE